MATNIFVDAVEEQPTTVVEAASDSSASPVESDPTISSLNIPNNIFLHEENEETITETIKSNTNFFELANVIASIKKEINPLHRSLKKKSKVFIFGAGGTTSWFLPKILKIYNDAFHKVPNLSYDLDIVLIDKDEIEPKNLIRQNFISEDIGKNKAQVLSERYSELYPKIKVSFIDKYATCRSFDKKYLKDKEYSSDYFIDIENLNIQRDDILINLVDNEGFKKKLDYFITRNRNYLFSAGVNLFNGQAYFSNNYRTNGYVMDHADLLNMFDEVSVHACADADANGTDDNPEQLFNGNDLAASLLANLYQTVLTDIPLYKRINFISGNNINVTTGPVNYSYLNELLNEYFNNIDPFVIAANKYVRHYGLDRTSKTAKGYYETYYANISVSKIKNIYDGTFTPQVQSAELTAAPETVPSQLTEQTSA